MMYFELVTEAEAVLVENNKVLMTMDPEVALAVAMKERVPFVIFTGVEYPKASAMRQIKSGNADPIWS